MACSSKCDSRFLIRLLATNGDFPNDAVVFFKPGAFFFDAFLQPVPVVLVGHIALNNGHGGFVKKSGNGQLMESGIAGQNLYDFSARYPGIGLFFDDISQIRIE